ncbi:MAG TPA: hypothetical protein VH008_33350 [Pseudonocardia sp.]|jgi:hypothetical protein|nr:hypothetical protein [Pseudonocardia sp.]
MRVAPLLSIAVAAGLLAGCASQKLPPPPPPPLSTFSTAADLGTAIDAAQKANRTATVTLTGSIDGQPTSDVDGVGVVRLDDAGPSMQVAEQLDRGPNVPGDVDLVIQPGSVLLKPPPDITMPPRKTWMQIPAASRDAFVESFNPLVASLRDSLQISQLITRYGDAVSIADSAQEPTDGTPAVRYNLRIDLTKVTADRSNPASVQAAQAAKAAIAAGQTSLELKLWLDEKNNLVRTLSHQQEPGNPGTFTLDAHYGDWGKSIKIAPPPIEEVAAP